MDAEDFLELQPIHYSFLKGTWDNIIYVYSLAAFCLLLVGGQDYYGCTQLVVVVATAGYNKLLTKTTQYRLTNDNTDDQ